MDLSIKWPFKWCLVGSSGSGKTNFALEVISHAHQLFDQIPSKIIIVYKEFQDVYNQINNYSNTFYNVGVKATGEKNMFVDVMK